MINADILTRLTKSQRDAFTDAFNADAKIPETLFGTNKKRGKNIYHKILQYIHPDKIGVDAAPELQKLSEEMTIKVLDMWGRYTDVTPKRSTAPGSESPTSTCINIAGVEYKIIRRLQKADPSSPTIFIVENKSTRKILMVSKKAFPATSRGKHRFQYTGFESYQKNKLFVDTLPVAEECFMLPQRDGKHEALLLHVEKYDEDPDLYGGLVTLSTFLKWFGPSDSLSIKDFAWIYRRILMLTGVCYETDVGIDIEHIMDMILIDPVPHRVVLLGTVKNGTTTGSSFKDVLSKICGITRTIGDYPKMKHAIDVFIEKDTIHPFESLHNFDYIINRAWGPRKYHEFIYPAGYKN